MTRKKPKPLAPAAPPLKPQEEPLRVENQMDEVRNTPAAADLMRRILRAMERARKKRLAQEQKHDAA